MGRLELATVVLLLGTHTFAGRTSAEEVLANPLVIERLLRGGFAGVALLLTLPILVGRIQSARFLPRPAMTALSLYFLVACISVLYSAAPAVTAGKAFELGAAVAILWAVALAPDQGSEIRSLLKMVVLLEAALLFAATIGFFLLPDTFASIQRRPGFLTRATMISPFAHSNSLSAAGALVSAYGFATYLTARSKREKIGWLAAIAAATLGMLLASGRQGLIIWLVAVTVLLFVHRRRAFLWFVAPTAVALAWLNWDAIWEVVARNQASASLATLSGRLGWWTAAIEAWREHPWLGYGFGAGGRFVALDRLGAGRVSGVHSGYIEAIAGVGVIGFALLAYAIWRVIRFSVATLKSEPTLAILTVPLLLHTFISLGFGGWLQSDFILFGLLVAASDMVLDRERSAVLRPLEISGQLADRR